MLEEELTDMIDSLPIQNPMLIENFLNPEGENGAHIELEAEETVDLFRDEQAEGGDFQLEDNHEEESVATFFHTH